MATRTLTAIFDSRSDAEQALARLFSLGVNESDARIVNQSLDEHGDETGGKGFWESIKDFFVPDDDHATYAEGLRRGGYLLTARVNDAQTDEAISILESGNAVDLDQRSAQWRDEGWTGAEYGQGVGGFGQQTTAFPASARRDDAVASDSLLDRDDSYLRSAAADRDSLSASNDRADNEQAIPIVRERLSVGKREVERGGVRVRSYVVEEPVHEEVTLRDERVEVERRPSTGATMRNAGDLLQERTIEVTARGEEAVVAKEAEVTEEVVVRKFEGTRTEGISDTVRHTEVDVDDSSTTAKPTRTRGSSKGSRPSDTRPR